MTKAMPFLQKAILLSYDPRRFPAGRFWILSYSRLPVLTQPRSVRAMSPTYS